ncbi:MAG: hypothetical protein KC400_04060 [Methanolinea sp.]|nr:hypothetical protein [Methanolinea sp.]
MRQFKDTPDRKRKSIPGLLLVCLVCVFAVISAGCGGDYVPNRDIVVIKLHPDGTTAWTQLIDSGRDDAAYDLIETPGGDLVISGGKVLERIGNPHPRLIRLSPEGSVLCDRVLDNKTGELISVARIQNGDYAAAMHHGEILWFDTDGSYLWSNSTGMQEIRSITGTMDGGLIIAGGQEGRIPFGSVPEYHSDGTVSSRQPYASESVMTPGCTQRSIPVGPDKTVMVTQCTAPVIVVSQAMVTKLDSGGNVSWERSYGSEGLDSAWSVLEIPDGYIMAGYGKDPIDEESDARYLFAIELDVNGTLKQVTAIDRVEYFTAPVLQSDRDGFNILYSHATMEGGYVDIRPAVVHVDGAGSAGIPRIIRAGVVTTWTSDGGYISAGFPVKSGDQAYGRSVYGRGGASVHAIRLDHEENQSWDREIPGIRANHVEEVVQIADGGYVILALKENY